jgi:2-aminoadipate transaminase
MSSSSEKCVRLSRRALWAEGQPISDLMARALANPQLISLAAGFVDQQSLPVAAAGQAAQAILGEQVEAHAALQYGTTHGFPPLRTKLLELARDRDGRAGPPTGLDQVVVTAGSNQLLHLIADTLLDPGDIVLTASPTYLVFLGVLQNLGCRAYAVATDDDGIVPEALDETLRRLESQNLLPRVKALYVVPDFDNPSGITMPLHRRQAILEIIQRWQKEQPLYIIADHAYRELRYEGEAVPGFRSLDSSGNTVIEAGTFSKSFSPGLRIGWGFLPEALVEPICHQKGNIDFGSPNLSQHLMAKVLQLGLYDAHVESLRQAYRPKLAAMLAAAEQHLGTLDKVRWRRPRGGLYVWAELPPEIDTGPAGRLFDLAVEEGVLYVPGQYCFPAEGEQVQRNTMRLSFGVQPPQRIEEGMAALGRAVRRAVNEG